MVGAFDQVVSVAVPVSEPVAGVVMMPVVTATYPAHVPLPPSPALAPETPPPIVA